MDDLSHSDNSNHGQTQGQAAHFGICFFLFFVAAVIFTFVFIFALFPNLTTTPALGDRPRSRSCPVRSFYTPSRLPSIISFGPTCPELSYPIAHQKKQPIDRSTASFLYTSCFFPSLRVSFCLIHTPSPFPFPPPPPPPYLSSPRLLFLNARLGFLFFSSHFFFPRPLLPFSFLFLSSFLFPHRLFNHFPRLIAGYIFHSPRPSIFRFPTSIVFFSLSLCIQSRLLPTDGLGRIQTPFLMGRIILHLNS